MASVSARSRRVSCAFKRAPLQVASRRFLIGAMITGASAAYTWAFPSWATRSPPARRLDPMPMLFAAIVAFVATLAAAPLPGFAATWADPAKTLRTAFEIDVTGFDPAATQDLYSNTVEMRIFDALYDWDYLKRPYALAPSAAVAMP